MSEQPPYRCGDSGGRTTTGQPCRFRVATQGARCSRHDPRWAGPDPEPSNPHDRIGKPRDWSKAVLAAYIRLTGSTIAEAAKGAGISDRTLTDWEGCSWWADACHEATQDRWLQHLLSRAKRTLFREVDTDGRTALQVIERLEPRLAPPKVRGEFTNLDVDPEDLTEEELVRIASGESPLKVLSETRSAREPGDGDGE
ncbi:MAG TPA: hypothetical protein VLH75_07265 [Longimicrobiales bacterium]|nr:hypothetical protein [Longimicrobiales bacterium]